MPHQNIQKPAWFMEKAKCPVSGLPVSNPHRHIGQQPGTNFSMELAGLGDRIIMIKASGYMRSEDEDEFLTCFEAYKTKYFSEDTGVVVVEDYAEVIGADAEARKKYLDYFKNSPFLLGGVIYNVSSLFRISLNLAKRLQIYGKSVYGENTYEHAISRAVKILDQSGIAYHSPARIEQCLRPPSKSAVIKLKTRFQSFLSKFSNWHLAPLFFLNRAFARRYSDALMKYIESISWHTHGAYPDLPQPGHSPEIRQVFDAIGFIKSEVDRLIQERLQAEQELKEREARYRQLVEHARAGIFEFDFATRRILFLNEALLEITEYSRDEMLAMNPLDLMTEDSREVYENRFQTLAAGGTIGSDMVYQMIAKSGEYKWVLFNTRIIFSDGRPEKACVVLSDITEMKRIEAQLLEYQAKLQGLSIQLSKTQETERRKLASRLHDSVSQELFVAQLQLNTVAGDAADSNQQKALNQIRDQIQKIIKDTKTLTFDLSPPILYDYGLKEAIEALGRSVENTHGISVHTRFSGEIDRSDMDRNIILYRSISELFSNTLKHAGADTIFISMDHQERLLQVDFRDNGIGFDGDHIKTPAHGDDGFGLFDIREKLQHLGGILEIETAPNAGTRVLMRLPLPACPPEKARSTF
ncbi:MAG: PAS domain S-box protein [Desulfobacterales bacterium]